MSYLSKLSRSNIHQAVIGDWSSINGMRAMNVDKTDIVEMGFSIETAERIVGPNSYDDAIIAALEATHRNESNACSIFANVEAKERFSCILSIKSQEFEKILELIGLQCSVDLVCELAPIWIENRRIVSRIRREYRKEINVICLNLLRSKKKLYHFFNLSDSEITEICNQEVKGRVKLPMVEELIKIDKAIAEAEIKSLTGIDKYIFIAKSAGVFINQVCYRENI